MPADPQETHSDPAADPKKPAFDALNDLLKTATAAASNPANTKAAQDEAFAVRTATSDQLQALDLAVFEGNTGKIEAAGSELDPGINQLKDLRTKIDAIGNGLKEAATIISGIDKAVAELSALA
jgi:hypothetical protein